MMRKYIAEFSGVFFTFEILNPGDWQHGYG
jgi:hypothetical protein